MSVNRSPEWSLPFLLLLGWPRVLANEIQDIKSGIWSRAKASLINLLLVQALWWCGCTPGGERAEAGRRPEGQKRKSVVGRQRGEISVAEGWRQKAASEGVLGAGECAKNRLQQFHLTWLYWQWEDEWFWHKRFSTPKSRNWEYLYIYRYM